MLPVFIFYLLSFFFYFCLLCFLIYSLDLSLLRSSLLLIGRRFIPRFLWADSHAGMKSAYGNLGVNW